MSKPSNPLHSNSPPTLLCDHDDRKPSTNRNTVNHPVQETKEGGIDIGRDIDPENEVMGIKLVLIHAAICLSTFRASFLRSHNEYKLSIYYELEVVLTNHIMSKNSNTIGTAVPLIAGEV